MSTGERLVYINCEPETVVTITSASSQGLQGYSAYEIAVQTGYIGTAAEWVASFTNRQLTQVAPTRYALSTTSNIFTLPFITNSGQVVTLSLNGVTQWHGLDYNIVNNQIVFTGDGYFPGDVITVSAISVYNGGVSLTEPVRVTMSHSGTTITLPYTINIGEDFRLDMNGVPQWLGLDFTISNTTLTFTGSGYNSGDIITYAKLFIG